LSGPPIRVVCALLPECVRLSQRAQLPSMSPAECPLHTGRLSEGQVRAQDLAAVTAELLSDAIGACRAKEDKHGGVTRRDQLPDLFDEVVRNAVLVLSIRGILGSRRRADDAA
jgi:hypothetical protein